MRKALESFESLIDLIDFLTEEIPLSSQNVDWFYNIGDDIKNVKNELEKCVEFENKLKALTKLSTIELLVDKKKFNTNDIELLRASIIEVLERDEDE